MKTDPIFEHDRREFLRMQHELKLARYEIKQLEQIVVEKKETKKVPANQKTIDDYTAIDFCKTFQKLFKEHYGKGFHITRWSSTGESMKKVMKAFYDEGGSNRDVMEFIKWSVKQKTHSGTYMNIGYLNFIIQDYRMYHIKKAEVQYNKNEADPERIKKVLERRFGK